MTVLKDPKLNGSQKASDNPFAVTHPQSPGGFFDYFFNHATDEAKQRNILGPEWLITITIDGPKNDIPWAEFGDVEIVDVGAGDGERMMKIAPLYENIKKVTFLDIDANVLAATKKDFAENFPCERKVDFEYQQKDYFESFEPYPKSTSGPLLFFMRAVLCDYSDSDILKILGALRPALEDRRGNTGAFLLIHELFFPSSGPPAIDALSHNVEGESQTISLPRPGWRKTCHYTERQCTTLLSGAQRSMYQLGLLVEQAGYRIVEGYAHRTMVSTMRVELA